MGTLKSEQYEHRAVESALRSSAQFQSLGKSGKEAGDIIREFNNAWASFCNDKLCPNLETNTPHLK